jgi:outer membrane immunogenic protein
MKKLLLSVAALALSAGAATAADLPSRKAPIIPPPPPPAMWTGFYVGLNAGYTWADSDRVSLLATDTGVGGYGAAQAFGAIPGALSLKRDGFLGGGQVGYNYQYNDKFVVGLEADIQGVASGSTSASSFGPGLGAITFAGAQAQSSLDYLGTVRGRIGYLVTPALLLYGTGGLAYGQANLSLSAFGPAAAFNGSVSFSDTRVGWAAGGGAEWMFMPNWSAKVEYLYYDLGTASTPQLAYSYLAPGILAAGGAKISTINASQLYNGHVIRVGLNYHFNWAAPAPVVAKY